MQAKCDEREDQRNRASQRNPQRFLPYNPGDQHDQAPHSDYSERRIIKPLRKGLCIANGVRVSLEMPVLTAHEVIQSELLSRLFEAQVFVPHQ
jgi:hypothetical protein